MTIMLDTSELERILKNTAQYCEGFIAGGEEGLDPLLMRIGAVVEEALGKWMDFMTIVTGKQIGRAHV